jgi:hypothetical protein
MYYTKLDLFWILLLRQNEPQKVQVKFKLYEQNDQNNIKTQSYAVTFVVTTLPSSMFAFFILDERTLPTTFAEKLTNNMVS